MVETVEMKTKRLEKAVREETIKEQVQVHFIVALCGKHGFGHNFALPLSGIKFAPLPDVLLWRGDRNRDDDLVGMNGVATPSCDDAWKDSLMPVWLRLRGVINMRH